MSSGCPSSNGQWCHRETSVAWKIFMFNRRMSPSHQHVICSICFIWFYFFNGQLNRILFVQGDDDQSIGMYIPFYTYIIWLVAWNMFFIFHILGMSSSQLMNSIIFQRGGEKPPTRLYTDFVKRIPKFSRGPMIFPSGSFPLKGYPCPRGELLWLERHEAKRQNVFFSAEVGNLWVNRGWVQACIIIIIYIIIYIIVVHCLSSFNIMNYSLQLYVLMCPHEAAIIIMYHDVSSYVCVCAFYHCVSSNVIMYHQLSPVVIMLSCVMMCHQLSSAVIIHHHLSSSIIIWHNV